MGLLAQLRTPKTEQRFHPSNPGGADLVSWTGGTDTVTGINVTESTALTFTTVYVCQKILAEAVGMLPLHIFERLSDGSRERATSHPNYILLNQRPNHWQTAYEFWGFMVASLSLWGNGYAQIMRKGNVLYGQPTELIPLHPGRMVVSRKNKELIYTYTQADGAKRVFFAQEILHVRNLLSNGLVGLSPISALRNSIALGMATEEFAQRFYANDATPTFVLKHPTELSPNAKGNIRDSWNAEVGGLENKHKFAILEEGLDIEQIGMPLKDAQFLELMKYSKRDISSIWRIPLNLLNDWEHNTFTNATEMIQVFHKDVLLPQLTCLQQAIMRDLFTRQDTQQYFVEFLPDALLRGDTLQRFTAYGIAIEKSFMKPNQARLLENWPLAEGGDELLVPLNNVSGSAFAETGGADQDVQESQNSIRSLPTCETRASRSVNARREAIKRMQPLIADSAQRVVNREVIDIRKKAKAMLQSRAAADFNKFLRTYYKNYPATVEDKMNGVFTALAEEVHGIALNEIDSDAPLNVPEWSRGYSTQYGQEHSQNSLNQLTKLIDDTEPAEQLAVIEKRMDEWEEKRAAKIADRQGNNLAAAMATAVFVAGGITRKVWAVGAKPCPLCSQMAGRTVSVSGSFLKPGDTVEPGGDTAPINVQRDFAHPPLHSGCECTITAG